MKDFRNLIVWQKSHYLALEIYKITNIFPRQERFGLIQQIRRSVISVSANIAEGSNRKTDKEYSHFLYIAQGSLEEVKNYLILSKDLHYINLETYNKLYGNAEEVGKLLRGFIKKLGA